VALLLVACGDDPAPPSFADAFGLEVPPDRPRGEPFAVPVVAAPGVERTTGTFSYAQRPTGEFGTREPTPSRLVEGTVDATRRAVGDAAPRRVVVEGTVDARESDGRGAVVPRKASVRLEFPETARGGAERKEVRLTEVPADLAPLLENVVALWTEPLPLPARPVRAGERFPPDVVDLEPLRRSLWGTFRGRDVSLPQVTADIFGAAWIESREALDGEDAVLLRTRLRQAAKAPLDRPDQAPVATVGYATALDRDRRVAVATGSTLRYESALRTRVRVEDPRALADYTVDVEQRASLRTTRPE
jgi:hypothetical protein